jgi:hypothetical protein
VSTRIDAEHGASQGSFARFGQRWQHVGAAIEAHPVRFALLASLATFLLYAGSSLLFHRATGQPIALALPLDDGWIHQVVARNLAQRGELAFNPGESSSGSTSALWPLLLAPGHWLGAPVLWVYLLGALSHFSTALLAASIARRVTTGAPGAHVPVATLLLCLLEWHLAWVAYSGMETLLFTAVSLLALRQWLARTRPAATGAALAAATWVRPEGLVLAGLLLFAEALRAEGSTLRRRVRAPLAAGVVYLLLVAPIAVLNLRHGGSVFPHTMAAKAAYYASSRGVLAGLEYLGLVGVNVFSGPAALLLLFAVYGAVDRGRAGLRETWVLYAWPVVLLGVFAVRLPVVSHFGRYAMPLIPVVMLLGLDGVVRFRARTPMVLVPRVVPVLLAVAALGWWAQGAREYVRTCRYITELHVRSSLWIAANTPPGAVVAAPDIGALGYFGGHRVLDMAGLITPEAVPHLGDEADLYRFVVAREAAVLVKLTDWFPSITPRVAEREVQRFRTEDSPIGDMVVYRLSTPEAGR